ncbi:MAG: alanine--tRNA ligase [Candidatus Dormibacteraeota bacterium]|nr:alanine--tRNA ligase [Candidatus Dormibacteraeota bacterium]
MTGAEIRARFLRYFQSRDHLIIESASIVPVDDPTTLFNSAGMQPLQPYYRGLRQPPHGRLVSCQKCFRVVDLDEVGRSDRHCTFFEMLGNFAPTGDYFKESAIPWAWEFAVDQRVGLGLDRERIRVTTHPEDDMAREIWRRETDLRADFVYDNQENWWGQELGPCGYDSELWWDRGRAVGCGRDDCYPDHCERFVEFWNLVFPQFDKQPDGSLPELPNGGAIDTGMGLDRISSILQGVETVFETDLFALIQDHIRESSSVSATVSERVVADHLRAMTFLIGDRVLPAKEGRGYVLRRVIRRAALHGRRLGLRDGLVAGVPAVLETFAEAYPLLAQRQAEIEQAVRAEEESFNRTLERGMELFERLVEQPSLELSGEEAFRLHDTFGFPLELTLELAQERGRTVDLAGFRAAMTGQRERSRRALSHRWSELQTLPDTEFTGYQRLEESARVLALRRDGQDVAAATEGEEVEVYLDRSPFFAESGGQVGDTGRIQGPGGEVLVEDTRRPRAGVTAHLGQVLVGRLSTGDQVRGVVDAERRRRIMRHHSATHLLNRALEEALQRPNLQRGSWVGPDHTTFDFPLDRSLSADELGSLERRINAQVRAALPMTARVLPYAEAVATGATHLFDEKYGDLVRVVCFGEWSCEFCGGTHCSSSAEVGMAIVTGESSVGQGLRRIDLTVGESAEELVWLRLGQLQQAGRVLGVAPGDVASKAEQLRREQRRLEREMARLRDELRTVSIRGAGASGPSRRQARLPLVMEQVSAEGMEDLRGWADRYLEQLGGSGVVAVADGTSFVIKVSRDLAQENPANELAQVLGRGGGQPQLAQGRLAGDVGKAFAALAARLQ